MSEARYVCQWCDQASSGAELSCPFCGAPVDAKLVETRSGWSEMPPIRDMARLEMGRSSCQIEGSYVPVADVSLAEGDGVYFSHHVLLWKEPSVAITTMSLKGAWKRLFAGLPLIMTQATGRGHIAFSHDHPGELIALPLQQGQSVDVREHVLVMATSSVAYDWFQTGIWFRTKNGDERETHYPLGMFMDRFHAPSAPGLVLVHGAGNVFVRRLGAGETILLKPTALLYKDSSVGMRLHFEHPGSMTFSFWRNYTQRYTWLRLHGPGRVAVQSAYKHFHEPGWTLVDSSPATVKNW
jgi:uncharacterized protein (AIM24 family)